MDRGEGIGKGIGATAGERRGEGHRRAGRCIKKKFEGKRVIVIIQRESTVDPVSRGVEEVMGSTYRLAHSKTHPPLKKHKLTATAVHRSSRAWGHARAQARVRHIFVWFSISALYRVRRHLYFFILQ
jgi:hypothetical protein